MPILKARASVRGATTSIVAPARRNAVPVAREAQVASVLEDRVVRARAVPAARAPVVENLNRAAINVAAVVDKAVAPAGPADPGVTIAATSAIRVTSVLRSSRARMW